jgi:hypothetical protein
MKHLKGQKTKLTNTIIKAQNSKHHVLNGGDQSVELMIYKNNDLDDITTAKYFKGDYIDIETLDKQIQNIVKRFKPESIDFKFPCGGCEFDQYQIYKNA